MSKGAVAQEYRTASRNNHEKGGLHKTQISLQGSSFPSDLHVIGGKRAEQALHMKRTTERGHCVDARGLLLAQRACDDAYLFVYLFSLDALLSLSHPFDVSSSMPLVGCLLRS